MDVCMYNKHMCKHTSGLWIYPKSSYLIIYTIYRCYSCSFSLQSLLGFKKTDTQQHTVQAQPSVAAVCTSFCNAAKLWCLDWLSLDTNWTWGASSSAALSSAATCINSHNTVVANLAREKLFPSHLSFCRRLQQQLNKQVHLISNSAPNEVSQGDTRQVFQMSCLQSLCRQKTITLCVHQYCTSLLSWASTTNLQRNTMQSFISSLMKVITQSPNVYVMKLYQGAEPNRSQT